MFRTTALVLYLASVTACAPLDVGAPAAPDLPRLLSREAPSGRPAGGTAERPTDLDLGRALALALERNPDLQVAERARRIQRAGQRQAREYPNPELSIDVEDVLGSGALRGGREAQVTAVISQTIELGGKGRARRARAEVAVRQADWKVLQLRTEVIARTARAFVGVLVAQARVEAAGRGLRLAGQVLAALRDRLDAGRLLPAALAQAEIRRSLAALDEERTRAALQQARLRLAAQWGSAPADFERAVGDLHTLPALPALGPLEARLESHPGLKQQSLRLAGARATLAVERAAAVPDLAVRIGYRYLAGPETSAAVVGVSIPLPLFSRNQGATAVARLRVDQAEQQQALTRARLGRELHRTHAALGTAHRQVEVLTREVLPAARRAFTSTEESFRLGRSSYLALLGAQATLLELEERTLEALAAAHRARIELYRVAAVLPPTAPSPGGHP